MFNLILAYFMIPFFLTLLTLRKIFATYLPKNFFDFYSLTTIVVKINYTLEHF
jgi:hypothetical protein